MNDPGTPTPNTVGACTGIESDSPTTIGLNTTSGILNLTNLSAYREELLKAINYVKVENTNNFKYYHRRYGYLLDLINGGEFKFPVPEYDVSTNVNWDSVSIIGRSVEILGYNSTTSPSVRVNLTLVAGVDVYANLASPIDKLYKDLDFIKSLQYPDYSKSIILPPPSVLLYLGPHLKMRGIVKSVSIDYKRPFTVDLKSMVVEVSFTVSQISENPPDLFDIRKGEMEGPAGSSYITSTAPAENTEDTSNGATPHTAEELRKSIIELHPAAESFTEDTEYSDLSELLIKDVKEGKQTDVTLKLIELIGEYLSIEDDSEIEYNTEPR